MQNSTKVLPFTIPKTSHSSFVIQQDKLESFYPHLHKHEEIQICWIKTGSGTLIVEADIHNFHEDDIFIIASNRAHLFRKTSENFVETLSLFFSVNPKKNPLMLVPELESSQDYFKNISSCFKLTGEIKEPLENILNSNFMGGLHHFIGLLDQLIHTIPLENKLALSSQSTKSEGKLRKIMEYTMTNYNRDIKISQIAKIMNYSPEAFCRFFRKRTGRTYISYVNDLRISTAAQKIIQQETTDIQSIAFECGFNNVSHFNRVFKQYKGISPLQFRKGYFQKLMH